MSNRVYLYCTNYSKMPERKDWDDFFDNSGYEFETNACIPLFWLCLYDKHDICVAKPDDYEFSTDGSSYPYLIKDREAAISNLLKRKAFIYEILQADGQRLFDEWIKIIKNENYKYIIIRTEELSWFYKGNEMDKVMISVLNAVNENSNSLSLKFPKDFYDFSGLDDFEDWGDIDDYELVGTRNSEEKWPRESIPYKPYQTPTSEPQKKWWHFWK